MKAPSMKVVLYGVLLLCVVAMSGVVVYHFTVTVPRQNRAVIEQREQTERSRKAEETLKAAAETYRRESLQNCIADAYDLYRDEWEQACKRIGRGTECLLPSGTADNQNEYLQSHKDECYKLWN